MEANEAAERERLPGSGEKVGSTAETSAVNESPRPKLADIAADWGTSVPYVSKCKAKGCPVKSIEAARKWRDENSGRGHGYRGDAEAKKKAPGAEPGADETKNAGTRPVKRKRLSSMEASLAAAVAVEEEALLLVQRAIAEKKDEKLPLRIAAYNKAKAGRLESEKRYQEFLIEARKLVYLDEAKALIKKGWGPVLSKLRSVPKTAAPLANPADDVLAERVIREEIEKAIAEGEAEYESQVV